ncbi:unnamed protein product [Parascedosporium putredinis]|uniref:Fucose-specific lectin n=1 Tax=Parascedosporium putredinis TaxID=1442378 RepID=A0A9P1M9N2_9PEZI|nr:unnamed protein product [Parascedosporium putredinis]CAI7995129.1 unnamed protein product [Parascedosporium putredinis]
MANEKETTSTVIPPVLIPEERTDTGSEDDKDNKASINMSPLAVIPNPVGASKDKIVLISCSNLKTLTFQHRTLSGDVGLTLSSQDGDSAAATVLAYPSSLTAMVFGDTLCVFGVTGNEGNYKISLVSPAYQPASHLSPKTTSLAGFSRGSTQGYLYYQGLKDDAVAIKEWAFTSAGKMRNSAVDVTTITSILPGTQPAAATDEKRNRWLAYQQADGRIGVHNGRTGLNYAIDSSPYIYVYFVDLLNRVRVAVSAIGSDENNALSFTVDEPKPTFASREGPTAHIKVHDWSQLAAVPYATRVDPDDEDATKVKPCNLLFGVTQDGESGISQIECDEWSK